MADAAVMTWGGLRGAVGLAMAIQVYNGRAPCSCETPPCEACVSGDPQISKIQAERMLFFVSGIALFTTIINAVTAPYIVNYLGITAIPRAQQHLVEMFCRQIAVWSEGKQYPEQVIAKLRIMLHDVNHRISKVQVEARRGQQVAEAAVAREEAEPCDDIVVELQRLVTRASRISQKDRGLLWRLPDLHSAGQFEKLSETMMSKPVDKAKMKAVNKVFLTLVRSHYLHMIEESDIRPGSEEAGVLLTSIQVALSPIRPDLHDYAYVTSHMERRVSGKTQRLSRIFMEPSESAALGTGNEIGNGQQNLNTPGWLQGFVTSNGFSMIVASCILLSGLYIYVEKHYRIGDNTHNIGWLIVEVSFYSVFVIEFALKFIVLRCTYFKDAWNVFDFLLVLSGGIGVVLRIIEFNTGAADDESGALVRAALAFRVIRLLRLFRLLEFFLKLTQMKNVSVETAQWMHKTTVLTCFIRAHVHAQSDLVKYFGGNGCLDTEDEAELARCVLQSQIACYKALFLALDEERGMDRSILLEVKWAHQRKEIAEGLEKFVLEAFDSGALTGREAEAILHPMNDEISAALLEIKELSMGVLASIDSDDMEVARQSLQFGNTSDLLKCPESASHS